MDAALLGRPEEVPDLLRGRGWVPIGAAPVTPPVQEQPTQVTVTARTIDYGGTTALAVVGTTGAVVALYASSRGSSPRVIRTATLGAGRAAWTLQRSGLQSDVPVRT